MQAVDLDLDLGAIATTACDEWREFRTRIARSKAVARFSCFARQVRVSLFTRLTPELSRPAERARRWFNHSASAETAKRARLERIVRPLSFH